MRRQTSRPIETALVATGRAPTSVVDAVPRPQGTGYARTVKLIERLREATPAEIAALAAVLGIELPEASEEQKVRVRDAYHRAAGSSDFRSALKRVAIVLAKEAKFLAPTIKETAEDEWLEDYVHEVIAYLSDPDRESLTEPQRGRCRERAESALEGKMESSRDQSARWVHIAKAEVNPFASAGSSILSRVGGTFFGPDLDKLLPATLLLIHIRKRIMFEDELRRMQVGEEMET